MVKMENITRDGDLITLDCFEEGDRSRRHHVIFDANTLEIKNRAESNIYVRQSIWRIKTILKESSELPHQASSYWC